jgi:hypothetical protein
VSKNLVQTTDDVERLLLEMQEHGGEFVALDNDESPIVYAATEEQLEIVLGGLGLRLCDVIVSRVPEYGVSYIL